MEREGFIADRPGGHYFHQVITVSFTNIITNPVVIQWNVRSHLFLLKMFHPNISNHETIRQIQIVGNPMSKWPGLFKMSIS